MPEPTIAKRHVGRDVGMHATDEPPPTVIERAEAEIEPQAVLEPDSSVGARGPSSQTTARHYRNTKLRLKRRTREELRRAKRQGGDAYRAVAETAIRLSKRAFQGMPEFAQQSTIAMGQLGLHLVYGTGDVISQCMPNLKGLFSSSAMFAALSEDELRSMMQELMADSQSAFRTLRELEEQQRSPATALAAKRDMLQIVQASIRNGGPSNPDKPGLKKEETELKSAIEALKLEGADAEGARSGLESLWMGAVRTPNNYYAYYGREYSAEAKRVRARTGERLGCISRGVFLASYEQFMDGEVTKMRDLFVGDQFKTSADPSMVRMHLSFQEALLHAQLLSVLHDYIDGAACPTRARMMMEMRLLACSAIITVTRDARSDGVGKLGASVSRAPTLNPARAAVLAKESYKDAARRGGGSESLAAAAGLAAGGTAVMLDMTEYAIKKALGTTGVVAPAALAAGVPMAGALAAGAVGRLLSSAANAGTAVDDNDHLSEMAGAQDLYRLPSDKLQTTASRVHGYLATKLFGDDPLLVSSNVWKTATTRGAGSRYPMFMESTESVAFLTHLMKGLGAVGGSADLTRYPHVSVAFMTTLDLLKGMLIGGADIMATATKSWLSMQNERDRAADPAGLLSEADRLQQQKENVASASAHAVARYNCKHRFLEFRLGMTTENLLDAHRSAGGDRATQFRLLPVPIFCDPDPSSSTQPSRSLMLRKHEGCARQDISAWLWAHAQIVEELEMWEAERELRAHLVEKEFWKRVKDVFVRLGNIHSKRKRKVQPISEEQEKKETQAIEDEIKKGKPGVSGSSSAGAGSGIAAELADMTLLQLMVERCRANQMRTRLSTPDTDLHETTKLPLNPLFTHYVIDEYEKWLEFEAARLPPSYYSKSKMKRYGWEEPPDPQAHGNVGKSWRDDTFCWEHNSETERRTGLVEVDGQPVRSQQAMRDLGWVPPDPALGINGSKRWNEPGFVWKHASRKKRRYGRLSDSPILRTMTEEQMRRYGWRRPEDKDGERTHYKDNTRNDRKFDDPQFWWVSTIAVPDGGQAAVARQGALQSYLLFPGPDDRNSDGSELSALQLLSLHGGQVGRRVYNTVKMLRTLVNEAHYRRRMYKRIADTTASSVRSMLLAKNPRDADGPVFTPAATQIKHLLEVEKNLAEREGRKPCYDVHAELVCKMNENDDGSNYYSNFHMEPETGCLMGSWLFTGSLSALPTPPTFMQVKNGRPFVAQDRLGRAPLMEREDAQYYMDSGELVQPKLMAVLDLPYIGDIDARKLKSTNTMLVDQMQRDYTKRNPHQDGPPDYAAEISLNFSTAQRCEVVRKVRSASVATLKQSINASKADIDATERITKDKVLNIVNRDSAESFVRHDLEATYDDLPLRKGGIYASRQDDGTFKCSNGMRHPATLLRQIAEADGTNTELAQFAKKHHATVDAGGLHLEAQYATWNSRLVDAAPDSSGGSADPDVDAEVLAKIRDRSVVVPTVLDPRLSECPLSAPAPIRLTGKKMTDVAKEAAAAGNKETWAETSQRNFGGRRPQAGVMLFVRVGGPGARAERFVRRCEDYDKWQDNDFQYHMPLLVGDPDNDSDFADKNVTLRVSVMDIGDIPGHVHSAKHPVTKEDTPCVIPYGPRPKPQARWMQSRRYGADGVPAWSGDGPGDDATPMRAAFAFPIKDTDWHASVECPGVFDAESDALSTDELARVESMVAGASQLAQTAKNIFSRALGDVRAAEAASEAVRLQSLSSLSDASKQRLAGQLASAKKLASALHQNNVDLRETEKLRAAQERIEQKHELEKLRQQLRFEREELALQEKVRQLKELEKERKKIADARVAAAKQRTREREKNAADKVGRDNDTSASKIDVLLRKAREHATSAEGAAKAIDDRFDNEKKAAAAVMDDLEQEILAGFDEHWKVVETMRVELSIRLAEIPSSRVAPSTAALRSELKDQRKYLTKQLAENGVMQRDKEEALKAFAKARQNEDNRHTSLPKEVADAQSDVRKVCAALRATAAVVESLNKSSGPDYAALRAAVVDCTTEVLALPDGFSRLFSTGSFTGVEAAEIYMQKVRVALEARADALHAKEQLRLRLQGVYAKLRRREIAIMKDNQHRLRFQRQFRRKRFGALQRIAATLEKEEYRERVKIAHRDLTVIQFDEDYEGEEGNAADNQAAAGERAADDQAMAGDGDDDQAMENQQAEADDAADDGDGLDVEEVEAGEEGEEGEEGEVAPFDPQDVEGVGPDDLFNELADVEPVLADDERRMTVAQQQQREDMLGRASSDAVAARKIAEEFDALVENGSISAVFDVEGAFAGLVIDDDAPEVQQQVEEASVSLANQDWFAQIAAVLPQASNVGVVPGLRPLGAGFGSDGGTAYGVGDHSSSFADPHGGASPEETEAMQLSLQEAAADYDDLPPDMRNALERAGPSGKAARTGLTRELQVDSTVDDSDPEESPAPTEEQIAVVSAPNKRRRTGTGKAPARAQLSSASSSSSAQRPEQANSAFPLSGQAAQPSSTTVAQHGDLDSRLQEQMVRNEAIFHNAQKRLEAEKQLQLRDAERRSEERAQHAQEGVGAEHGESYHSAVVPPKGKVAEEEARATRAVATRQAVIISALQKEAQGNGLTEDVSDSMFDLYDAVNNIFAAAVNKASVALLREADANLMRAVAEVTSATAGHLALVLANVDADSVLSIASADAQITSAMNMKDALFHNTEAYVASEGWSEETLQNIQGVVLEQMGACVTSCLMTIRPVLTLLDQYYRPERPEQGDNPEAWKSSVVLKFLKAYKDVATDLLNTELLQSRVNESVAEAYYSAMTELKRSRAAIDKNYTTPAAGVVVQSTAHRQWLTVSGEGVTSSARSDDGTFTIAVSTKPQLRLKDNGVLNANRKLVESIVNEAQQALDLLSSNSRFNEMQLEKTSHGGVLEEARLACASIELDGLNAETAARAALATEAAAGIVTDKTPHLERIAVGADALRSVTNRALGQSASMGGNLVSPNPHGASQPTSALGAQTGASAAMNLQQMVATGVLRLPSAGDAEAVPDALDEALRPAMQAAVSAPAPKTIAPSKEESAVVAELLGGPPAADSAPPAQREAARLDALAEELHADAMKELTEQIDAYRAKQRELRAKLDALKKEFALVSRAHYADAKTVIKRTNLEGDLVEQEVDSHQETVRLLDEMWKVSAESWSTNEGDYIAAMAMRVVLKKNGKELMLEFLKGPRRSDVSSWREFLYMSSKSKKLSEQIKKREDAASGQKVQIVDVAMKVRSAYEKEVLQAHLSDAASVIETSDKQGGALDGLQDSELSRVMKQIYANREAFLTQYSDVPVESDKGLERIMPMVLELEPLDVIETMTRSRLHFAALERQQMMARRLLAREQRSAASLVEEAEASVVTFMKMPTRAVSYFDLVSGILRNEQTGGPVPLNVERVKVLADAVIAQGRPGSSSDAQAAPRVYPEDEQRRNVARVNAIVAQLIADQVDSDKPGGPVPLGQEGRDRLLAELNSIELPPSASVGALEDLFLETREWDGAYALTGVPLAKDMQLRELSPLTPGVSASFGPQTASAMSLLHAIHKMETWLQKVVAEPRGTRLSQIEAMENAVSEDIAFHGSVDQPPRMRGNPEHLHKVGPFPTVMDMLTQGDVDYMYELMRDSREQLAANLAFLRTLL